MKSAGKGSLGFCSEEGRKGVRYAARLLGSSVRSPKSGCATDNPLDLSISLEGGEETNKDFPSSGERTGTSPNGNRQCRVVMAAGEPARKAGPQRVRAP